MTCELKHYQCPQCHRRKTYIKVPLVLCGCGTEMLILEDKLKAKVKLSESSPPEPQEHLLVNKLPGQQGVLTRKNLDSNPILTPALKCINHSDQVSGGLE